MSDVATKIAGAIHLYLMESDELLKAIASVKMASCAFLNVNPHMYVEGYEYGDVLELLNEKKKVNEQRIINLKEKLATEMIE